MDQYLSLFIEEAREHLQNCNNQLLELERNPGEKELIQEIFRSAHTIKGMSATMGFEDMANLTHQMENVLDALRNEEIAYSVDILDLLFEALDYLETMLDSIVQGGDGSADVTGIIHKLQEIGGKEKPSPENPGLSPVKKSRLTYDEFERTVIEQSYEQGFRAYEITVTLREDCLLKSARAYLVFDALEKIGEIIKAVPPVEDLEAEQFEQEFTVTLLTKEEEQTLRDTVLGISEIQEVEVLILEPTLFTGESDKRKASVEEINPTVSEEPSTKHEFVKKQNANLQRTIRVNIDRLNSVMNLFEELVIDRGRLEQIASEIDHPELMETVEKISRVTSNLQTNILNIRMVPIEMVFNRFPKMIRQLSRELGKKIRLEITGQDTELDRSVIDEIGDPLIHLLRNSADHGIEMPEERKALGKPEEGKILLKAYHSGNHVFIEVEDDGAGIDRDKVLQKALEKGIVSHEESDRLTDQEIYELIFASGFSTAEKVSDISGRGVGLDVVKKTIESLGGIITVSSEPGKGTKFIIQLPLTLSIISVLLVQVQDEKYGIPLTSIVETALIEKDQIKFAHDRPVIDFRGKIIPLLSLKDIFQVPETSVRSDGRISIVIVRKGEKLAALIVDDFIGQQEVVLKSLGNYLKDVFAISGATILGDGHVSLIIDCNALIK